MKDIVLTRGFVAVVDDEDFDLVAALSWYAEVRQTANRTRIYARTTVGRKNIYLHRLLLNVNRPIIQVDHINGDGLDNRRANLRVASNKQNSRNRVKTKGASIYKGVTRRCDRKAWVAQICVNTSNIYLGSFRTEEEAARAYDAAAQEHFGDFVAANFQGKREQHCI